MITWRPYFRDDWEALRRLHKAWCGRAGVRFAFPDLDDPRYLLTRVAERNGAVAGAVTAHATVELMLVGANAAVARSAIRERAQLAEELRAAGCDEAHAFVPVALLGGMEPLMRRAGFRRSNQEYTTFYASL